MNLHTLCVLIVGLTVAGCATTQVENPNCAGVNSWATSMDFVHLRNAGITNNDRLDVEKTKSVRLASEKTGNDLYRQLHLVTFTEKSGNIIDVITSNDASSEECSMSGVTVYVVSRRLGGNQ